VSLQQTSRVIRSLARRDCCSQSYRPLILCVQRKLHNFGPATTTFTAPTSCLTAYPETRIGRASDIAAWADWTWQDECLWDRPVVTDCRETALAQQSLQAFITEGRARVSDVYTIIYQSPGVACPSGYLTVGGAEKVETSTKYSGAFNVSESAFDMLISALDPGESAVLCCPRFVQLLCFWDLAMQN